MKKLFLYKSLLMIICLLGAAACGDGKKQEEDSIGKSNEKTQLISVDTLVLAKRSFQKQIVCNGKLRAVVKSDLAFNGTGVITAINIRNGDRVDKGTTLAMLDTKEAKIELRKASRAMTKANIDLVDKLIGLGYTADTTAVPTTILQNMKATSGYESTMDQLETAERQLANCYLVAPFSGRVANLDSKVYSRSTDKLCTLIDDSYFDVEFSVLEAEMEEVTRGLRITVSPFINEDQHFVGEITEINPLIDDKGQIKVRAKVRNYNNYLVEGMNVKILLEREVKQQFVVPKDAVVLRDGFQVIFLYKDGKAVWTYVDVVMSNIDSHVITGNEKKQTSISEKDVVIVSNNLNLADGTEVTPN